MLAGALGLAVLLPGGVALAQSDPPRDPSPPAYEHGYHHGDGEGCYQHADPGNPGAWHHGHHDNSEWHRGM